MNIKNLRLKTGMTQSQLALSVSVNQSAVASWERESTYPTADKLPVLASVLGCSIDELFTATRKETA